MTYLDNQFLPNSHTTYEQFKVNFSDENLIRWADRFLNKYTLSCSYKEIEIEGSNRIFSQYSSLFGVVLAYQAFDDISELCFHQKLLDKKPSQYTSSNELLHEELVSNTKLCDYLKKSANKSDEAIDLLYDSLEGNSKDVVVFGNFLTKLFLKQDFTSRNLGISNASDKNSMLNLRNYLNSISNRLFTVMVKSLVPSKAE